MSTPLLLKGLDGGNPLAFLALLGCVSLSRCFLPEARFSWTHAEGAWKPQVHDFEGEQGQFAECLHKAMAQSPTKPFEIDKRLPFLREKLHVAMRECAGVSSQENHHEVDLLAGMGSDAYADDSMFLDTSLRMVRSGDSKLQGFPFYALAIQKAATPGDLLAALFSPWRYEDDGYSLRWDPIEDQRYALRWRDPKKDKLGTVRGANALAIQALALLPVQPQLHGVATTGFARMEKKRDVFTWPIWTRPISRDVIRSLLSLRELGRDEPDRDLLLAVGVEEIFRSERVAPNKYYKNFTHSRPI